MNKILALFAASALLSLSACTVFQDDIYKVQSGHYMSDSFDAVEAAIHDEFADRYGENNVYRADIEWQYNHWTVVGEQRAIGHDKYRVHISAYPQLDADGKYEPVVIVREEAYTGASYGYSRGGPTAMYSGKWSEIGRDASLEADLANSIYARLNAGGADESEAGGR